MHFLYLFSGCVKNWIKPIKAETSADYTWLWIPMEGIKWIFYKKMSHIDFLLDIFLFCISNFICNAYFMGSCFWAAKDDVWKRKSYCFFSFESRYLQGRNCKGTKPNTNYNRRNRTAATNWTYKIHILSVVSIYQKICSFIWQYLCLYGSHFFCVLIIAFEKFFCRKEKHYMKMLQK